MFCPKCGTQNPETGRFCRSCGTDLGNVSQALTGQLQPAHAMVDRKGKPASSRARSTKCLQDSPSSRSLAFLR